MSIYLRFENESNIGDRQKELLDASFKAAIGIELRKKETIGHVIGKIDFDARSSTNHLDYIELKYRDEGDTVNGSVYLHNWVEVI